MHRFVFLLTGLLWTLPVLAERDPIRLTHGPMLGHVTADSVRVWARTSDPGEFLVRYGTQPNTLDQESPTTTTRQRPAQIA